MGKKIDGYFENYDKNTHGVISLEIYSDLVFKKQKKVDDNGYYQYNFEENKIDSNRQVSIHYSDNNTSIKLPNPITLLSSNTSHNITHLLEPFRNEDEKKVFNALREIVKNATVCMLKMNVDNIEEIKEFMFQIENFSANLKKISKKLS